jgi:hypothetical protein
LVVRFPRQSLHCIQAYVGIMWCVNCTKSKFRCSSRWYNKASCWLHLHFPSQAPVTWLPLGRLSVFPIHGTLYSEGPRSVFSAGDQLFWGFSGFSWVPTGKYWDTAQNRPQLPPFLYFQIYHHSYNITAQKLLHKLRISQPTCKCLLLNYNHYRCQALWRTWRHGKLLFHIVGNILFYTHCIRCTVIFSLLNHLLFKFLTEWIIAIISTGSFHEWYNVQLSKFYKSA